MTVERAPLSVPATTTSEPLSVDSRFDDLPPGERYFRHPGDVLRLVVWGLATIVLLLFVELAEGTNDGLREDGADVVALIPVTVRQLAVTIAQVVAILVPGLVIAALVARQRWRRLLHLALGGALGFGAYVLVDRAFGIPGGVAEALEDDFWLIPARFPSAGVLAGRQRLAPSASLGWRERGAGASIADSSSSPSRSWLPAAQDSPK